MHVSKKEAIKFKDETGTPVIKKRYVIVIDI